MATRAEEMNAELSAVISRHLPEGALLSDWFIVWEYAPRDEEEQVVLEHEHAPSSTLWKGLGMLEIAGEDIREMVRRQG